MIIKDYIMEQKIYDVILLCKEKYDQKQYVKFVTTIKEYCESQIKNIDDDEYKIKLFKKFCHNKNICEFIQSCNISNEHDDMSRQCEYIHMHNTTLKNDYIYISIQTSSSESNNWGNGPEEIEINIGKTEKEQIEILRERCVFADESYQTILLKQEFKDTLKDVYDKIKNKNIVVSCDDIYSIIKVMVKMNG